MRLSSIAPLCSAAVLLYYMQRDRGGLVEFLLLTLCQRLVFGPISLGLSDIPVNIVKINHNPFIASIV